MLFNNNVLSYTQCNFLEMGSTFCYIQWQMYSTITVSYSVVARACITFTD